MSKKTKIEVEPHWLHSLSKLRCWIEGFHAGRRVPGTLPDILPGEDVLRQMQVAIQHATIEKDLVKVVKKVVDKKSK